ncbi:cupin domain-containing protein [Pseudomonas sp. efr-133-TYG-103a]|uniref:cupin domain-containing protein n=1 Tax=Pseudomonas sp. efr-133-TYG-103a TaxID=3040308 RepID=UPI00359C5084
MSVSRMMKRTSLIAMALLSAGCSAIPSAPPAIESRVLLKSTTSWEGSAYQAYPAGQPELTVMRINIPANTSLKWHQHPMPNAAYVVSGQLRVETRDGGKSIMLKPGDVLPEIVDRQHRGVTGDSAVELVVFYAGTPGLPLSQ